MIPKMIFWSFVCIIFYTYLGYPVILKLLTWLRPIGNDTRKFPNPMPKITLLIPAYNEESVIAGKIENSLNLNYEPSRVEIVVASDGSQDRTNEIVSEFKNSRIRLLAYPKREGKVNVLNKSIPQISTNIVVLSDANTMYECDAIGKMVRHFSSPEVGCVCGELKLVNTGNITDGDCERLYWNYERVLKRMEGKIGAVLGANGAIYAIRKNLFETLPSDVIIDDFVLSMKIAAKGYRIIYEPEAVGVEETQSVKDEFRRRVRIGIGNFQSIRLLRSLLNPLRGLIAFSFWSHKILRWAVPFLLMGVVVSNVFILETLLHKAILLFQASFYFFALLGGLKEVKKIKFPWIHLVHYFVVLNTALFCGFLKFLFGWISPIWTPTTRNSNNHTRFQTIGSPKNH